MMDGSTSSNILASNRCAAGSVLPTTRRSTSARSSVRSICLPPRGHKGVVFRHPLTMLLHGVHRVSVAKPLRHVGADKADLAVGSHGTHLVAIEEERGVSQRLLCL